MHRTLWESSAIGSGSLGLGQTGRRRRPPPACRSAPPNEMKQESREDDFHTISWQPRG